MRGLRIAVAVLTLTLSVVSGVVASDWATVYQTDFSVDPTWTTTNPDYYYWIVEEETYFVRTVNIPYGGYYTFHEVEYNGESFMFEFDVIIDYSQYASGIDFGLYEEDMDYGTKYNMRIQFLSRDGGHATRLLWQDDSGGHEVMYTGDRWDLDTWYHVTIAYDHLENTAAVTLEYRDTGLPFFSFSAANVGPFSADMKSLGSSAYAPNHPDYQCNYCSTQGRIDNVEFALRAIPLALDIRPAICPNTIRVNPNSQSMLQAAILGTVDLDVSEINVSSVKLGGVPADGGNLRDVATPPSAGSGICECSSDEPDGFEDIVLRFDLNAVIEALGDFSFGEELQVDLSGQLSDGRYLSGTDCITVLEGKTPIVELQAALDQPGTTGFSVSNHPNPFNPSTDISFSLPKACNVKLEVYNIVGQKVTTLVNGHVEAGNHTVSWDGSNAASGVYLYRLEAADFVETKKMLLVK